MENVWVLAALWVGLALLATLLAIWFKISTALTEIVVGTVAQLIIGAFIVQGGLGRQNRLDRLPRRDGSNRSDLSRRSRTRPRHFQNQVERGGRRWPGRIFRTVHRMLPVLTWNAGSTALPIVTVLS